MIIHIPDSHGYSWPEKGRGSGAGLWSAVWQNRKVILMADKLIDPVIYKKEPVTVKIGPGEYKWCACGLSKNQPYCDGSHDGTGFGPATINLAEERELPLCQCKRTKMPPLCDGTHAKLK